MRRREGKNVMVIEFKPQPTVPRARSKIEGIQSCMRDSIERYKTFPSKDLYRNGVVERARSLHRGS